MSPHRALLNELLAPVADDMERMRGIVRAELADASPAVADMVGHVARFQGKQLRAALVLLTGEACGNTTDEHPAVAAIVEMIHLATLVHDDVLDGAEKRRRVAAVHRRWDNQVAVLLGDFLYARAFGLSTRLSSRLPSQLLSDTTRRLCVGEIEQSAGRYDFEQSQADYERVAGAKTASLYAAACELGARYPGAGEQLGQAMRAFGWELGLAFQIIDDCLDIAGDEERVGKTVGTDVEDGKVTLAVLHTYATAHEGLRARIRDIYTTPGLGQRAVRLRETVDLGPGLEFAMSRAQELVDAALGRLARLPASPARRAMEVACEFVLQRTW